MLKLMSNEEFMNAVGHDRCEVKDDGKIVVHGDLTIDDNFLRPFKSKNYDMTNVVLPSNITVLGSCTIDNSLVKLHLPDNMFDIEGDFTIKGNNLSDICGSQTGHTNIGGYLDASLCFTFDSDRFYSDVRDPGKAEMLKKLKLDDYAYREYYRGQVFLGSCHANKGINFGYSSIIDVPKGLSTNGLMSLSQTYCANISTDNFDAKKGIVSPDGLWLQNNEEITEFYRDPIKMWNKKVEYNADDVPETVIGTGKHHLKSREDIYKYYHDDEYRNEVNSKHITNIKEQEAFINSDNEFFNTDEEPDAPVNSLKITGTEQTDDTNNDTNRQDGDGREKDKQEHRRHSTDNHNSKNNTTDNDENNTGHNTDKNGNTKNTEDRRAGNNTGGNTGNRTGRNTGGSNFVGFGWINKPEAKKLPKGIAAMAAFGKSATKEIKNTAQWGKEQLIHKGVFGTNDMGRAYSMMDTHLAVAGTLVFAGLRAVKVAAYTKMLNSFMKKSGGKLSRELASGGLKFGNTKMGLPSIFSKAYTKDAAGRKALAADLKAMRKTGTIKSLRKSGNLSLTSKLELRKMEKMSSKISKLEGKNKKALSKGNLLKQGARPVTRELMKTDAGTGFNYLKTGVSTVNKVRKAIVKLVKAISSMGKAIAGIAGGAGGGGCIVPMIIGVAIIYFLFICLMGLVGSVFSFIGGSADTDEESTEEVVDETLYVNYTIMGYLSTDPDNLHQEYVDLINETLTDSNYAVREVIFPNGTEENYKEILSALTVYTANDITDYSTYVLTSYCAEIYAATHKITTETYTFTDSDGNEQTGARVYVYILRDDTFCYELLSSYSTANLDKNDWMSVVRTVSQAFAESGVEYANGKQATITINGTEYKQIRTDTTGFITLCLRIYGAIGSDESVTAYSLGCTAAADSIPTDALSGFRRKAWTGWEDLETGDIIAYYDSTTGTSNVAVFAYNRGGLHYVYACNNSTAISTAGVTTDNRYAYTFFWRPDDPGSSVTNDIIYQENLTADSDDEDAEDLILMSNTGAITYDNNGNEEGYESSLLTKIDNYRQTTFTYYYGDLSSMDGYIRGVTYEDGYTEAASVDFVGYIYSKCGITLGPTGNTIMNEWAKTTESDLLVGDLLLYYTVPAATELADNTETTESTASSEDDSEEIYDDTRIMVLIYTGTNDDGKKNFVGLIRGDLAGEIDEAGVYDISEDEITNKLGDGINLGYYHVYGFLKEPVYGNSASFGGWTDDNIMLYNSYRIRDLWEEDEEAKAEAFAYKYSD